MLAERMAQFRAAMAERQARLTESVRGSCAFHAAGTGAQGLADHQAALLEIEAFYDRWSLELAPIPDVVAASRKWRLDEKLAVLSAAGQAAMQDGRLDDAGSLHEEALALARPEDGLWRATLLGALAQVLSAAGRVDEADQRMQEAIEAFQRLADSCPPENRGAFLTQATTLWLARAELAMRGFRHSTAQDRLDTALALAADPSVPSATRAAIELKQLELSLATDTTGEILRHIHEDRDRLGRFDADPGVAISAKVLVATNWLEHGEPARAVKLLRDAAQIAEQAQGDEAAALASYQKALGLARDIGAVPQAFSSTLGKIALFGIQAEGEPARAFGEAALGELRRIDASDELAVILPQRALRLTAQSDAAACEAALRDLEEAEGRASCEDQRWLGLLARLSWARRTGKAEEAFTRVTEAIDELQAMARRSGGSITDRASWLNICATLHKQAACLAVDLGRRDEALQWGEGGRALRLREHMAKRVGAVDPPRPLAELGAWLTERRDAVVCLSVTGQRTLLVGWTAAGELVAEFVDLAEAEVEELLPRKMFSDEWTARVFAAARALQARLLPALLRFAGGCRTLYVVPDSRLCFLPFAALASPDGLALVDHCALAMAPSLAVLRHCHARAASASASASSAGACLAVGVGRAETAHPRPVDDFAFQAQAVAALGWRAVDPLLQRDAVAARLLDGLRTHAVVHIAAHGRIDGGGQLSSSRLSLADGDLSARTIAELGGSAALDLVFLNACLSGRFESTAAGEIGGFWEAFLRAGASTLVAPLTYVDPGMASALAVDFHRRRQTGRVGKAEALRQAQLDLRASHPATEAWGAHVLVGDGE